SAVGSLFPRGTRANVAAHGSGRGAFGSGPGYQRAGKNGPPGKYERWLSSASSGSVELAMITDRVSSP
ncbi:hypothetical protein PIB30_100204, partial [Stylosanthes scabra]|nr:hypothetical protein [Stylosanthes scabra]